MKLLQKLKASKIFLLLVPALLAGGLLPFYGGGGIDSLEGISMCTAFYNLRNVSTEDYHWLYFPGSAGELSTRVPYVYLAGNLIKSGAVDASDCGSGGLYVTGAANTCGLEKALPLVYQIQNMFDDEIINAGLETGIPPVLLKQQIRYASQFWPGRATSDAANFGLGHVTAYGASTGLLWNTDLYQEACQTAYGTACTGPYNQSGSVLSDPLVGVVLDFVNADCPNCQLGFDTPKAEASVLTLAQIDLAHCVQTERVLYNLTESHSSKTLNFATLWKLALFDYAAGPTCLYNTAARTLDENAPPIDWVNFSENARLTGCYFGVEYVDRITAEYYSFGQ